MRVLHFFKTYLPDTTGGIEQVIFQLCEQAHANGVQAQVLTLSPEPTPETISVEHHQVTRARQDLQIASTGLSLDVFKRFQAMARDADVIHFHFPWPMMDLVHFCTRHGRPSVVSYHSDIVRQQYLLKLYRPLMNRFLNSVQRIMVASPNYQQSSEVLRPFSDKTVVVPYGLNVSAYPQASAERLDYWRKRVGQNFFLFVGVLRYYKGLSSLLDALRGTAYPLVVVGSGPEEGALKEQAARLQLQNVVFLGRVDDQDKVCLLQLSLALVFPSHLRSEAFGISLLEASMLSKPMISCEIGSGTTYVNQHELTGLVVPPASPLALRAAMQRLWSDEVARMRFGSQARLRFEQLFTADRMWQNTLAVYNDAIDEAQSRA
ncbi:glycosyltransferase family 4 protein [Pseudomonas yangonensis]|uniref:glycosyltransferase family 4 protein n=1 Tax=Pseudomonas yangonensis TaxID=2579922 RepID=UPI00137A9D47|nr:glycosyltransferase family 4 protein [Pseudomonas yangonensis]